MIRIGHLLDASAGWEQRVAIGQLVNRLPRDDYACAVATLAPTASRLCLGEAIRVHVLRSVAGVSALAAPAVGRFTNSQSIDLVFAWGIAAAAAVGAAPHTPLVVQLFDPRIAADNVKLLRTISRRQRFAVICSSEIVRRRLIEGGLGAELTATIRPGVDFNLINRHRRGCVREDLGLARDDFVVIVPDPVTRSGGQFEACQAVTNLHHVAPKIRLIVPGASGEVRRINRVVSTLPRPGVCVVPASRYRFEELLANADALLVTPRGDVSTTAIAWAMGSGAVVIGTAVYAVAELITNKVNGLLFKCQRGRSMAAAIVACLRDHDTHRKVSEVARGQAYEVFGVRRYVEQCMQLCDNVMSGRPPAKGITDSSIAV